MVFGFQYKVSLRCHLTMADPVSPPKSDVRCLNPTYAAFRAGRRTIERPKSDTAMKTTINIEIECTPAEARSFLGLPDVEPIQAAVMERMQEKMLSEIDKFSPESLINQWVSAFPPKAQRMQEIFAKMFMAGLGQGRH